MAEIRKFDGQGEAFDGDTSLGWVRFEMRDTSTARGRSADGSLDFADGLPAFTPVRPITIEITDGVRFQVVITRVQNGQVTIASHGPIPSF